NLIELSKGLLKFQMGVPQNTDIVLTDSLDAEQNLEQFRAMIVRPGSEVYSDRIEYSLLQTQEKLAELDIRNVRSGYLPVVSASLGYGHNNGNNIFGDLWS